MDQLRPFASTEASQAFQILCDLEFRADALELRYKIQGPIEDLVLPMTVSNPNFRDELWTTTCLELFLQEKGRIPYEEWNFSPSGNWAYYGFQAYRQPADGALRLQPLEALHWIRSEYQLLLHVKIPLIQSFATQRAELRYGITAVLHLKSGEKQYWALTHAGEKPDFHLAAGFSGEGRPG